MKNYQDVEKIVVSDPGDRDVTKYRHPAFGMATVQRATSSGNQYLFGSKLTHHHTMNLTISHASMERRNNSDSYYEDKGIISISMSETQWAHLVASSGMGSGTPVTIERGPPEGTQYQIVPGFQLETIKSTFESDLIATAKRTAEDIKKATDLVKEFLKPGSGSMKKSDIQALLSTLIHAGEHFPANMDYMHRRFTDSMEEAMSAAKTEIEAYALDTMARMGASAIEQSQSSPVMVISDSKKSSLGDGHE